MDVNVVNPLLQSFTDILPQMGFERVEKVGLSVTGSVLESPGILVNIGMVGMLSGAILIGMNLDSGKRFASKMMMGMEVNEFDSLAQSAISEMGNMICANACTNFSKVGISSLDISPPTLLIGKGGQVMLMTPKVLVVNFLADDIPVDVYVSLAKR